MLPTKQLPFLGQLSNISCSKVLIRTDALFKNFCTTSIHYEEPSFSKKYDTSLEKRHEILKAQSQIFGTSFNPDGIRAGNKILRRSLKGPSFLRYYPQEFKVSMREFLHKFRSLGLNDPIEEDRKERADLRRRRGKAPPKKKAEKVVSRKKKH